MKKWKGYNCCKCKKHFKDYPAISNLSPGFDRCEKCYKEELEGVE